MLMHLEEKEKERITKTNSFVSVVYQISKVNHQEKKRVLLFLFIN